MIDGADARISEITARLWNLVRDDFGGGRDPDLVQEVKSLTDELRRLLPNNALSMRISSLVNNVEVACSPARWRKEGIDRVRSFAREDAYVIKGHV